MNGQIIEVFEISGRLSSSGSVLSGQLSGTAQITGEMTIPEVVYPASVYDGDYTVVPKAHDSTVLETKDKMLLDDVTVTKVPYYETHNESGFTAYIASEV